MGSSRIAYARQIEIVPAIFISILRESYLPFSKNDFFYPTQLRPTLKGIDAYVIRWARRKYKRMVHWTKGARDWFDRLRRANPTLFAHWPLCHGNGRTSGAV
jgi:hypothetical protein